MNLLQVAWFLLIGVLLAGYAVLDGFDLGVGIWHLFARKEEHRRMLLQSIGPVWDGNEVWLLTGGGAIFAAFPHVYATVFSGFYLALMLVLLGLILRAVSVEFRNKESSPRWRGLWDIGFAVGSMLPALLFGVALGNILRGLPLDEKMDFAGTFPSLLNPYALMIGLLGFAMLAVHGAAWIVLKTEGPLAEQAKGWLHKAWIAYLGLFLVAVFITLIGRFDLLKNYNEVPFLYSVPAVALIAIVLIGVSNRKNQPLMAFAYSAVSILALMCLCGAGLFPNLVPSLGDPKLSLTIVNASSTPLTLKTMLIVALIGMPLVLVYTVWIYRTFGGKVRLTQEGY